MRDERATFRGVDSVYISRNVWCLCIGLVWMHTSCRSDAVDTPAHTSESSSETASSPDGAVDGLAIAEIQAAAGQRFAFALADEGAKAAFVARSSHRGPKFSISEGSVDVSSASGPATLSFRTRSIGRETASVVALGAPREVSHEGNRVSWQVEAKDGSELDAQEWYVHGPLGLEQGYTLQRAPAGKGTIEIRVAVSGVRQVAQAGRTSVLLRSASSSREMSREMSYAKLFAHDADKRALPAELVVVQDEEDARATTTLALRVDDEGAEYPITIDPIISLSEQLLPSAIADNASYGASVSISGDYAVVGAFTGVPAAAGVPYGTAFTFARGTDGTWSQEGDALTGSRNTLSPFPAQFGVKVSLSGDTLAVGAPFTSTFPFPDPPITAHGAAYVYVRDEGTNPLWTEQVALPVATPAAQSEFGRSVSVSGNTLAVGAPGVNTGTGAVYIYTRSGGTWSQQGGVITASGGTGGDQFGLSVAVDEAMNTLVVGAPGVSGEGRAYIFERSGSSWSQEQVLEVTFKQSGDDFGRAVAISEATLVVGAPGKDVELELDRGAAEVYEYDGTDWVRSGYLSPAAGEASDRNGGSVAVNGSTVIIGSPDYSRDDVLNTGSAHVFQKVDITWEEVANMFQTSPVENDQLGFSVAVSDDTVLLGAPGRDSDSDSTSEGTTYIYTRGSQGEACTDAIECGDSLSCVDGYCCDTACGDGDATDCQACNVSGSEGTCTPIAADTACRAAAGGCDVEEVCDGTSTACPADELAPVDTECRTAAGLCDVAEVCDGSSTDCPADTVVAANTECRAASGECDVAEVCDGSAATCPEDATQADGTDCSDGTCEAGICMEPGSTGGGSGSAPGDPVTGASGSGESGANGSGAGNSGVQAPAAAGTVEGLQGGPGCSVSRSESAEETLGGLLLLALGGLFMSRRRRRLL